MQVPRDAVLLRIFVGENDRLAHEPLYEAIVMRARELHLAGATVLRGPLGFGHSSRIHTTKLLEMSSDLSYVIEIVDKDEKVQSFLPELDKMMIESNGSGLVTLEHVQVLQYGPVSK
jgi:PII-like signaling protein